MIYVIECLPCKLQYVGSSKNFQKRWPGHKKSYLDKNSKASGLSIHYATCQHDDLSGLKITLIDQVNSENQLWDREKRWMTNLGTINSQHGLNSRFEANSNTRLNYGS